MMTPSRKASRATVITASIAIGVFGAGAGLGTVIAARSHPAEERVMRLAAGTYHLDDGEQAWKSRGSADGDPTLPLSGADEGSTITGDGPKESPRVCLTTTTDGHAVGGGGGGCVSLAVLASAASALQRPGNPKSTASSPPKRESSAPEPRRSTAAQPAPEPRRSSAPLQPAPETRRSTAAQPPPAKSGRSTPPPAPAPTKKIAGDISESGSRIEQAEKKTAKKVDVEREKEQPTPKPAQPSDTGTPAQPTDAAKPTVPAETPKPPANSATPTPSASAGEQATPTATPGPSDTRPPGTPTPAPSQDTQLPQPDQRTAQNPSQAPDGSVLQPATPLPDGEVSGNGDSLPIFRDPELLRRAQEALGLDKNMRYTDENGVWDLNIAPPGTPPCRDYSAAELQRLGASQDGGPAIPRDSCQWPAFIRWLYAEPAPGEVSNWTKFTGLPERNLELVVTDPSTAPPARPDNGQVQPDSGQVQPDTRQVQPDNGQVQPDQPDQAVLPDTHRVQPDTRQVQPDNGPGQIQPDPAVQSDTSQVHPDPFGYNGP